MRPFIQSTRRGLGSILANTQGRDRRELLATYTRFRLRHALNRALPCFRFERARICGYDVRFSKPEFLLHMFDEIFVRKHYEFDSSEARPLVLDCGANVGVATIFFKRRYPDANIIAFEPDPRASALLRRNVDENGLRNVEVVEKALAEEEGEVKLFLDPKHPLVTSTRRDRVSEGSQAVTVEAARLSSFVNDSVEFLKLDVEGSEFVILNELARSGKLDRVTQIAVEFHHHIRADEDEFSALLLLLEENGFGYQIVGAPRGAQRPGQFQDILVRAYRKSALHSKDSQFA